MTALLTIMHGHLDRVVAVSPQAYGVEGSSVYLVPGQKLTVRDLLYGLLLVSGNDAAVELAIAVAGSVPRFVAMMNVEAKLLGATHTTFLNPDGLYLPGHRTTAHDLALIARAALAYPEFRKIIATRYFDFPGVPKPFMLTNQDALLWNYPGAIGARWLHGRGAVLHRRGSHPDGVTLLAVALHTDPSSLWSDPATLLNWGFANFQPRAVVLRGETFGRAHAGVRARATAGFTGSSALGSRRPRCARNGSGRRRGTKANRSARWRSVRLEPFWQ